MTALSEMKPSSRYPALRWREALRLVRDYDCQQCGACCVSDHRKLPGYVALTPTEAETLGRLGLSVLNREDGLLELGTVPAQGARRVCVAFQGTVGLSCGCGIYDHQPAACCVPDPTAAENLERPGGRGLLLMRACSSWVRFSDRGNAVTLCKYPSTPLPLR